MPKGLITCYDCSLLLELFGKSVMHVLYLWWYDEKEVFFEELQQEIQWQPIRMFGLKNASCTALWFSSVVNLAFF